MAKMLYASEVLQLIQQATTTTLLPEDERTVFLEKLGDLVGETFGAAFSSVHEDGELNPPARLPTEPRNPGDDSGHCFAFHWCPKTPEDMGVFQFFDCDITIDEWRECSS